MTVASIINFIHPNDDRSNFHLYAFQHNLKLHELYELNLMFSFVSSNVNLETRRLIDSFVYLITLNDENSAIFPIFFK